MAEPRSATIEAGGVRARCLSAGRGEPVILLHGLGASAYSWRSLWAELGEGYAFHAPDWPGFGRSEKPWDFDYSPGGLSRWLVAFLDKIGAEKAHLVGNSLGGLIALWTTLESPERVKSLALIGTPTYLESRPKILWPLRWPVLGSLYEWSLGPWAVAMVAPRVYVDKSVITSELVSEYGGPLREAAGRRAVAQFMRNAVPEDHQSYIDRYPGITQPTLVMIGEADYMVGVPHARRFSKTLPRASLEVLAECGHAPQEEKPREVAGALLDFLGKAG